MLRSILFIGLLMLGSLFAQSVADTYIASRPGSFDQEPYLCSSRAIFELIENGGCEELLVDGNIPRWTEVVGVNWTQRSASPPPQEGGFYFFPGVSASAELAQDVDVSDFWYYIDSGNQEFEFSGYVRSYTQSPADWSRIVTEYLNADKTVVLSSFDSGNHTNTSDWMLITDTRTAPVGTRFIRIRLISTRKNGSNNDGYYDNLSLKTEIFLPLAPQNASVVLSGNDVILDWDSVSQDELGNPVDISYYQVYAGDIPEFECIDTNLVGTVPTPGFVLYDQAQSFSRRFFKITAIRSYGRNAHFRSR